MAEPRSVTSFARLLRLLAGALLVGWCAGVALSTPVYADSIVYVKRGDVWLANPGGKRQRPMTRSGSPRNAYRSPSQSDAGTIVALRGRRTLHVFNRHGRRLRRPRSITGGPNSPLRPPPPGRP